MLVDLDLALVAIRCVLGLDTQTGSDQTESHLEGKYVLNTYMHRLGVFLFQGTSHIVILQWMNA